MAIQFKAMIETFFGNNYDFVALAKMDHETAENLAKQLLVQEGNTVPVEPVYEAIPEEPQSTKKTYFGIKFIRENNYDFTNLAFENADDVQKLTDFFNNLSGKCFCKEYGNTINKKAGVVTGVESESFSESQFTDEQRVLKEQIDKTKDRNKRLREAYEKSCKELDEQRAWIEEERGKAIDTMDSLKLLARTFLSTNAIVGDVDKTMELLAKNNVNDMIAIANQMAGSENFSNENDLIENFMGQISGVVQEYAANMNK